MSVGKGSFVIRDEGYESIKNSDRIHNRGHKMPVCVYM